MREGVKMKGVREGVKMRRCEDEKMRYRPPLLEEPCAQTLSGKMWIRLKKHLPEI